MKSEIDYFIMNVRNRKDAVNVSQEFCVFGLIEPIVLLVM